MLTEGLPPSLAGRPRIGITSATEPRWGPEGDLWRTLQAAIEDAGGAGVWLGASSFESRHSASFDEVLQRLDGLLVPGGADIAPEEGIYVGLPPLDSPEAATLEDDFHMDMEPDRDAYELPLVRRALEMDMPVFGICRGFQVMNVAGGGRLIPDLRTGIRHRAYSEKVSSAHLIQTVPGSRIEELEGSGHLPINSRHHQGITPDLVAPGMEATAFSLDGIVEVIEDPKRSWRFAVQWHPERPEEATLYERDRCLFRAFVEECRNR